MSKIHSFSIVFVLVLLQLVWSNSLFAKQMFNDDSFFRKDYLTIELVGNYPVSPKKDLFSPNKRTWFLGYGHLLNEDWYVGINIGFKSLLEKESGQELALLTVSNQSMYVIRLFHPAYLMIGTKLIYMAPTKSSSFPLTKQASYETEIGAGMIAQLAYFSGQYVYHIRMDRWRGTKTNKLHGFEVAVGISYGLKN